MGDKADDVAQEPLKDKLVNWISEDMAGASGADHLGVPVAVDSKSHAWQQDPHVLGAYAIFRPGQALTVARELAKPFDRVHFAGEHLADWQGFMEGAVATGQDAAAAVAASSPARRDRPPADTDDKSATGSPAPEGASIPGACC